MNNHEIKQLLEKARKEEPESLAVLCTSFYPKVLKYMQYRVSAEVAQDLTGEVFLRVMRGISRQKGSFIAWLYKIAANIVTDYIRSKKARREKAMDDRLLEMSGGTGDMAEAVNRRVDLQKAISQLTEDQKELVILKFVQGLSNAQVGAITGRSPEAIRGLQFRALAALQKILESEG